MVVIINVLNMSIIAECSTCITALHNRIIITVVHVFIRTAVHVGIITAVQVVIGTAVHVGIITAVHIVISTAVHVVSSTAAPHSTGDQFLVAGQSPGQDLSPSQSWS